jgi:hypothetical protein
MREAGVGGVKQEKIFDAQNDPQIGCWVGISAETLLAE